MTTRSRRIPATGTPAAAAARVVATWFGVGYLPGVPGTWGSLAALPFAWAIAVAAGGEALAAAAAALFALGCWASDVCERESGRHDPGMVVVDEVAAQWLTLAVIPPDPLLYAAGFLLFRAADIAKPWPARLVDRRMTGGIGIMLDDLFAAIYAGGALYALHWSIG